MPIKFHSKKTSEPEVLMGSRESILRSVQAYVQSQPKKEFIPGITPIPFAARVIDEEEIINATEAALDGWFTSGRFTDAFESSFSDFFGLKSCLLTNSGSSANLLALSAITSPLLGHRRAVPGDEVITVAAGFPTTVNPIIQNQLTPVFVDIDIGTYNAIGDEVEGAITPRTKAIILAHTLGNPFDLDGIGALANRYGLFLIEDCCDAVGSRFQDRLVGTFGEMATVSFFPAHHMTMGEGGAVLTRSSEWEKLVRSFRDWGRDCFCDPGASNSCGQRFAQQHGTLPFGYDHKYVYSHVGYNLKITDFQAAIGLAQLKKLPWFIERRKHNFQRLKDGLHSVSDQLVLPIPTPHSDPSWFAFPITVKPQAPFSRNDIISHLEANMIMTRMLFGGNLARQPAYQETHYRTFGNLKNTDAIMNHTFFIGVYPGITDEMVDYMVDTIKTFVEKPIHQRKTVSEKREGAY